MEKARERHGDSNENRYALPYKGGILGRQSSDWGLYSITKGEGNSGDACDGSQFL